MDPHRAAWNKQQKVLHEALAHPEKHPEWIDLFFSQHAQVHSAQMSSSGLWSFEDEILNGLDEHSIRCTPPDCEHSIAWILFHLARIEDVTMNMLVLGGEQLAERDGWLEKMKTPITGTGNAITLEMVSKFSEVVDLDMLRSYRISVGRCTRQIVGQLKSIELNRKVDPDRMQQVVLSGVVVPAAKEVLDYWGSRTISGLLLMPATRHCILHLNEAEQLKHSMQR